MAEQAEKKRLFFALEAVAPWSPCEPSGRSLMPFERHMTLAFLGDTAWKPIEELLALTPSSPLSIAPTGYCDSCLILPHASHPRLVAWHVAGKEIAAISLWQKTLSQFLSSHGIAVESRHSFMPHITLCRAPCDVAEWKKSFSPLPIHFPALHLYQSCGALRYSPLWSQPLLNAFEQLDHTADIAFTVRGDTLESLTRHALTALAFSFPELLAYAPEIVAINSLNDVIAFLNEVVSNADIAIGAPFKAVSQHGKLLRKKTSNNSRYWQWEMIVDV